MSSAYGDVFLTDGRVQVRSPGGNNEQDLGEVMELNEKYHLIVLVSKAIVSFNSGVDLYRGQARE